MRDKCIPAAVLFVACCAFLIAESGSTSGAPEFASILGTNEATAIRSALDQLNMTDQDLGFEKDVAKPDYALGYVRRMLHDPLALPAMGDNFRAAVETSSTTSIWDLAHKSLEVERIRNADDLRAASPIPLPQTLDESMSPILTAFTAKAERAWRLYGEAFSNVTPDETCYVLASELAGLFDAEDRQDTRAALYDAGIPSQQVATVIQEGYAFDPAPAARRYMDIVARVDFARLFDAGRILQEATEEVKTGAQRITTWPASVVRIETPCGAIIIGTTDSDRHLEQALLILDPAGDDVYASRAASANGFTGAPLCAVVDLAGNDLYSGTGLAAPGAAIKGVCTIIDVAGNDTYRAEYIGHAATILGVAWLQDEAGDDTYRARGHSQAAAAHGLAVLRDASGRDTYDVGMCGQAFAGVRGFALLIDDAGNDVYTAGGWKPDYERNDHRFLTLAQGFAIGMRPFAGGGVAALVDRAGNDTYVADVYGQGVSYWYSVGMLLDLDGHDSYSAYHYAQGSGIHLSFGLLADFAGNDTYTGTVLAQGNGHDYGIGMLFDKQGNDTYTAERDSQGRALFNGLALLLDSQGDDLYNGRYPDLCQGIGFLAPHREYGCLSLLLDLGGKDHYSCGAQDRASMRRPYFGLVYDSEPPTSRQETGK